MKLVFKPTTRALLLSVTTAALLATPLSADCTYELFNISSVKGTSVGEFIDQISDECGMSVIVADAEAENILKKQMNKTYLKNLTINEVLDLIIKENDLQYTLQNNVLKITYLTTKTYNIDYITTERKGTGSTNIRLSSNSGTSSTGAATTGIGSTISSTNSKSNNASSESGTNITTVDEVKFWETLEQEVKSILSRPEDQYREVKLMPSLDSKNKAVEEDDRHNIFINKNAGLITVTGTGKQIKRLDTYINDLEKKMQTQVMIDVKMYSVVFNDGSTTGIDWSQIYNLQNFKLGFDKATRTNVTGGTFGTAYEGDKVQVTAITGGTPAAPTYGLMDLAGVRAPVDAVSKLFTLSNSISINNLLMFLKTQGDVYAISNPKIMTLNNQPALITAGTELFYKTLTTSTLAGGSTGTQSSSEVVSSVFSGVLLDITPEISKDGMITLRINPSVSETASALSTDNALRTMPPDLSRRQISSVVSVQDGSRIVLGGLINRKSTNNVTKVPFLGDIPVVGYLFKQEGISEKVEELVIIIEPHIVKKDGSNLGLSDLGYSRLAPAMEKDQIKQTELIKTDKRNIKEMKEDTK
ncbi:MAG: pilus (MSHA type) biogenesis protein MshL [Campylobacterales bacterium]|nr:pilus (MSHA type) biogenesis protein MshL [Campylobacterales bacterium]